jgi:hypothetical protein
MGSLCRKVYKRHFGSIPRDFDVHHIDGNRKNNDPTNLTAISLQEHYNIHLSQKDWGACLLIAARMKASPEKLAELASLHMKNLWANPDWKQEQIIKIKTACNNPDYLVWLSKTVTKKWEDPNHRKKVRQAWDSGGGRNVRLKGSQRTEKQKESDKRLGNKRKGKPSGSSGKNWKWTYESPLKGKERPEHSLAMKKYWDKKRAESDIHKNKIS